MTIEPTTTTKECAARACGRKFEPRVSWQIFCNDRCGRAERLARHWMKKLKDRFNSPTKTGDHA